MKIQPKDHCHGDHQQMPNEAQKMSDQSFGRHDPRVTSTEHKNGTSFQMEDGAILQALHLVT